MILVTGGAGYVGSHFVRHYAAQNPAKRLVVIDNLTRGHIEALSGIQQVNLEICSIGDSIKTERIFTQYSIDTVIHFAASAYVGESQVDPFKYFRNNVVESLGLFEVMEKHGVRRIVFSSTCATYGNPQSDSIDESHGQRPANIYGATKLMIEEALAALVDSKGWSAAFLRYFNAAGATDDGHFGESHEPETHLIPNMLSVATGKHKDVVIHGNDYETRDGTCIRDYIHVEDLARAHVLAMKYLAEGEKPQAIALNLGTAVGASILEVLQLCEQVTKRAIAKKMGPKRPGDPANLVANARKAEEVLGWRPELGLQEIIESAWKWESNRRY